MPTASYFCEFINTPHCSLYSDDVDIFYRHVHVRAVASQMYFLLQHYSFNKRFPVYLLDPFHHVFETKISSLQSWDLSKRCSQLLFVAQCEVGKQLYPLCGNVLFPGSPHCFLKGLEPSTAGLAGALFCSADLTIYLCPIQVIFLFPLHPENI